MRFVILMISLSLFAGCGPMLSPMAPRLDVETQQKVDQIWNNLLTPVDRVDRQTLLDTNVSYWMYTLGVDRLHMTSEKYFSGGAAIMVIDCDRANPDSDQYTITIVDHQGKTALDAAAYFIGHGLNNVRCLRGGIDAWAQQVDPKMRRYRVN